MGSLLVEKSIEKRVEKGPEKPAEGHCRDIKDTLGHFALVSYLPDPLASFLDHLRIELTPLAKPRAHVTILPPRPHDHDLDETVQRLRANSRSLKSFAVEMGEIRIFAASSVVYLDFSRGEEALAGLYHSLNRGTLEYPESFPYHPHVTIAQNVDPQSAPRLAEIATERWRNYAGPRGFVVDRLSFVQHVAPSIWVDIAKLPLARS